MIYVLSDIHGNLKRFESIMKQINLQPDDTLYILGDVVDRNPDGIKILRKLMKMPNVKMLIGNHEYMMLKAIGHCKNAAEEKENTNWKERRIWYNNGGRITHDRLKRIQLEQRAEVFKFIRSLPVNLEVEVNGIKYKLVHASPEENYMTKYRYSEDYKTSKEFAVWERWNEMQPIPEGYVRIFGHTPTCYFQTVEPWSIWKGENAIGIDCGGAYCTPNMLIKLRQGVGRLIRCESDTGVVSILDPRAISKSYSVKIGQALHKFPKVDSAQEIESFMRGVKDEEYYGEKKENRK